MASGRLVLGNPLYLEHGCMRSLSCIESHGEAYLHVCLHMPHRFSLVHHITVKSADMVSGALLRIFADFGFPEVLQV